MWLLSQPRRHHGMVFWLNQAEPTLEDLIKPLRRREILFPTYHHHRHRGMILAAIQKVLSVITFFNLG